MSTAPAPGMSIPMTFTQPALPYPYTATEPFIDARTNNIHFTKHLATYYTNLNTAASTNSSLAVCSYCSSPTQEMPSNVIQLTLTRDLLLFCSYPRKQASICAARVVDLLFEFVVADSDAPQSIPWLQMMKLEAIIPALNMGTPKAIRNNAGGIFNHLIFFKVMLLSFPRPIFQLLLGQAKKQTVFVPGPDDVVDACLCCTAAMSNPA